MQRCLFCCNKERNVGCFPDFVSMQSLRGAVRQASITALFTIILCSRPLRFLTAFRNNLIFSTWFRRPSVIFSFLILCSCHSYPSQILFMTMPVYVCFPCQEHHLSCTCWNPENETLTALPFKHLLPFSQIYT